MDLGLQAKLLRVLQEGEFRPGGGMETVRADVRVLPHQPPPGDYVEEGKFRQDLYYRLNVIPLKLPPLRERGQDIPQAGDYFVDKYCRAYGWAGRGSPPRPWTGLWPTTGRATCGSCRTLMERAVLLPGRPHHHGPFSARRRQLADLEAEAGNEPAAAPAAEAEEERRRTRFGRGRRREARSGRRVRGPGRGAVRGHRDPGRHGAAARFMKSLDQTEGNRTQAAQLLGISVRTLRNSSTNTASSA